jgi:plastocyanin
MPPAGKTPVAGVVTILCVRTGTLGDRWLLFLLAMTAGALGGTAAAAAQPRKPLPGGAIVRPAARPMTTAATPSASGSVTGRVAVMQGQRLPEMIVYLEATDPKFTFALTQETVIISQQKAKFSPGLLVVPVGTRVDFRNDETGPVEHNVFSNSEAKKFDLGLYKPNEPVAAVKFDTPGAVRLRCSIHRYMDGVIYVTPSPYYAVVDKDGSFTIPGVRPGAYRLKTWQRSQRYKEADLPVSVAAAGEPADVTVEMKR